MIAIMVTQFATNSLPMSRRENIRRSAAAAVLAATLAVSLAACSTQSSVQDDNKISRLLVSPDKFVLYNCPQLDERAKAAVERQNILQGLIARAGSDSGGRLVSAIAYQPESLELRGEMIELRKAARAKNCKFVPGAEPPRGPVSNRAVR